MGEIRSSKKRIEVYDAQNRLQATIKEKPRSPSKKKSLLGVILFVGIILFAAGLPAYMVTLSLSFFVIAFIGAALAVLGGYYLFSTYERPEWHVETPEGKRLAEIKQVGKFFAKYQVLAPDGDVIAHIHKKRGLAAFRHSLKATIPKETATKSKLTFFSVLLLVS